MPVGVRLRPAKVFSTHLWAEKSRVKGARGYRVSTVKEPRLEKEKDLKDAFSNPVYCLKTTVMLDNAAIYSSDQGEVTMAVKTQNYPASVKTDLESLQRAVNDFVPGLKLTGISARGELLQQAFTFTVVDDDT